MLRRWTLARKIALAPALAGLALGAIVAATVLFGGAQRRALSRIERGYYPALQTQQRLQAVLGSLQRRLQDAAAASDLDGLRDADSLRDEFQRVLTSAEANPAASAALATARGVLSR